MALGGIAKIGMIAALAAGIGGSGIALAQGAGLQAAEQRHDNFEQLGKAFKTLKEELAKDAPDRTVVTQAAARVNALSRELPGWFPKGSGKEAQPKSEALPVIWTDTAGFSAAATKLQGEAARLDQVAPAGDIAAIRLQFQATGQACGACHKLYREKKN